MGTPEGGVKSWEEEGGEEEVVDMPSGHCLRRAEVVTLMQQRDTEAQRLQTVQEKRAEIEAAGEDTAARQSR